MTTTPAMPELPKGVTLEDLLIPLRAALDTCHDTDWTLRQFKTHIAHALSALATLQSQPAAPLRLDQIDLEPLKAELSDPAKAKAFLQKHGFLNASGELAEQYGGKPAQPAAAGVSDAALQAIDDAHDWQTTAGRMAAYRAILALRPQAEPVGEAGTMPGTSGFTMACFHADKVPVGTKLYADALRPQAVPMTAASRDVLAERQRQISAEGWTPEHDDEHGDGSMAVAASCYACSSAGLADATRDWPWAPEWFKPSDKRRDLIKAGALILAEIERLDRASGITAQGAQGGEG